MPLEEGGHVAQASPDLRGTHRRTCHPGGALVLRLLPRSTSRCASRARPARCSPAGRYRSPARCGATGCDQPTPLGALLTASHNHRFGVGLTWFSCCGFFVDSIAGHAGNATHFWAFKVGHALSSLGAGSVKATPGMHALFYWTTFDPNTGATEPTLGLRTTSTDLEPGATATFTVVSYDDAGTGTPAAHAWVSVNGAATQAGSLGRVTVRFTRTGTFARPRHPRRGDPVADGMGARRLLVAWAILGAVGGGCGSHGRGTAPRPAAVTVTVTRDFGRSRIDGARAAPGPVGARCAAGARPGSTRRTAAASSSRSTAFGATAPRDGTGCTS